MKNRHYTIVDNEGGGDCFFAVIRDAYRNIPKPITVSQLRKLLSEEASEKIFKTFKEQYDMYVHEIAASQKSVTVNTRELREVKENYEHEPSRNGKLAYVKKAKKLLEDRKDSSGRADMHMKFYRILNLCVILIV